MHLYDFLQFLFGLFATIASIISCTSSLQTDDKDIITSTGAHFGSSQKLSEGLLRQKYHQIYSTLIFITAFVFYMSSITFQNQLKLYFLLYPKSTLLISCILGAFICLGFYLYGFSKARKSYENWRTQEEQEKANRKGQ